MRTSKGLALMMVMMALMVASLGTLAATVPIRNEQQSLREQELLFIGEAFKTAIESYSRPIEGSSVELPKSLEDLVADTRGQVVKRHLRKLYRDPITDSMDWGLIRSPEGIVGVYSKSKKSPKKRWNFPPAFSNFSQAKSYSQWQFIATSIGQSQ
jgi:hypothetical protein